jgi:hypothetical protein
MKKQRMEAAKARADAARPREDPEPPPDEGSCKGESVVAQGTTTSPDSFRVFRKYLSLSSHNPDNADPFSNMPSAPSGAASQPLPTNPIGSNITVSSTASDLDPLANLKNPTVDLLLSWYSEGSTNGAASLDRLVNCLRDPHFNISQLKDFTAVSALHEFEQTHLGFTGGKG